MNVARAIRNVVEPWPVPSVREMHFEGMFGNLTEVIDGETGLLLGEKYIDGVVHGLIKLIDEPEMRAQMAAAGHRYAAANFHPERMCDAVLEIYEALLQG
jgi:glycosyltransferase involved in cell wall biosynthesis